jgi:hypothetical protein
MTTRAAIVAEARTWDGTRFRRQCRLKGVATDCIGFGGSVLVNVGAVPSDSWTHVFAMHSTYGRNAPDGLVVGVLSQVAKPIPIDQVQPADLVVMRMPGEPQHLAILTPRGDGLGLIHALFSARKVVEHRLDEVWRSRITHAFSVVGGEA